MEKFKGDSALRCWGTVGEVKGSGKAVTHGSTETEEIRGGWSLGYSGTDWGDWSNLQLGVWEEGMEEALLWNSGEEWSRLSKQRGVVERGGGGSGEGGRNSNPGNWWAMKQPGRAGGCRASAWGGCEPV